MRKSRLPLFAQETPDSCLPACLRMVLATYELHLPEPELCRRCRCHPGVGTDVSAAVRAAQRLGFGDSYTATDLRLHDLRDYIRAGVFPIVGIKLSRLRAVQAQHAQVVAQVTSRLVSVHDPLYGRLELPAGDFEESWASTEYRAIIVL